MAEMVKSVSMESSDPPNEQVNRLLELAVPLFSFGGAFLAIFFSEMGIPVDFHYTAIGCVIASCILAYLAWIRPKKDIVALTTPIYAFIFFLVPTDEETGIVLQLLYAVSLTILLVRLKYRFGKPGTAASLGKELGGTLKTYIDRTSGAWKNTSPDTAHRATLVFVQFAQGDYGKVANISATVTLTGEESGHEQALSRAFAIVREHAELLDKSLPRPYAYQVFRPEDADLLAHPLPPSGDSDHEFYLSLDNALLLLYSVAWSASGQDQPHLLPRQPFAQKLMNTK
jgi:hypothetical protein